MQLELTDEEAAALLAALNRLIDNDRYPLSPRIKTAEMISVPAAQRWPRKSLRSGNPPIAGGSVAGGPGRPKPLSRSTFAAATRALSFLP
jgi:hypothetical protein